MVNCQISLLFAQPVTNKSLCIVELDTRTLDYMEQIALSGNMPESVSHFTLFSIQLFYIQIMFNLDFKTFPGFLTKIRVMALYYQDWIALYQGVVFICILLLKSLFYLSPRHIWEATHRKYLN